MKIRTRLSLNFIIITALIYCLSLAFIYSQFKEHIRSEVNQLLENKARMTAEMVLFHEDDLHPDTLNNTVAKHPVKHHENTSIYNAKSERVYSLISGAPLFPLTILDKIRTKGELLSIEQDNTIFGFTYTSRKNKEYIVISEDKPDVSKLIKLRNILLLSTLITILILIISGWVFGRQTLLSFSKTISEINNILPIDLSKRIKPRKNEDELNQLISTFNQLLERIDNAFKTEKSFISNVSHELKNPITSIQAQIQYAANKDRSVGEYQNVLQSLEEDIDEMAHMVEKLLQLSRIQNTYAKLNVTPIRIDELIYQCKDSILKIYPESKIKVQFKNLPTNEEEMYVNVDEVLIKLAIYNIIENACKFSPDHSCQIFVDQCTTSRIQITIQNYGPIISANEMENIFKPFYRSVNQSHIKGSGIGLSLVKTILDNHQIPIEVKSSSENGNEFILTFDSSDNQKISESTIAKNKVSIRSLQIIKLIPILILFFTNSCQYQEFNQGKKTSQIIETWYDHMLVLNRYTDGYRPPVSARTFAYIGIGAWTCLSMTNPLFENLQNQISGLPFSHYSNKEPINLEICLNAYYYQVIRKFYPHTLMTLKEETKKLYEKLDEDLQKKKSTGNRSNSISLGNEIAEQIYKIAAGDSISHMAYLFNYDPNYYTIDSHGIWSTSKNQMPALLPHWGESKLFTPSIQNVKVPEPPVYSESNQSTWFKQAWEIYTISQSLTYEEKWITEFWSDDFPGVTFCAASRWVSIAINFIKNDSKLTIEKKLEILGKLGIGLNDAAVIAWRAKYFYKIERPVAYINRLIDKNWQPFQEAPSFPSYPSGHSIFGAVSAGILKQYVDQSKFPVKEISHAGRKEFLSEPRIYNSLDAMAEENARSRMYRGVHYRNDCEQGLNLGYAIADEVNKIRFWTLKNED